MFVHNFKLVVVISYRSVKIQSRYMMILNSYLAIPRVRASQLVGANIRPDVMRNSENSREIFKNYLKMIQV
jgi:hypothetical protein